uniref:Hemolysin n=1 Tax=Myoviridae sp. ct5xZ3 TaxID=2827601 RepID=A0A8S5RSJ4_9CAUD|nr:MAG TPA: hemolysin [Myoviridae sp. ct5xZ3]
MEDAVGRGEFEEYQKRIEEEDHRQNGRIKDLEESTKQIGALTVSIEKLAQSVQSMVREQEAQGKRLASLEGRDGEMWRKVVGYVVTAVIGVVIGFVFTQIGM